MEHQTVHGRRENPPTEGRAYRARMYGIWITIHHKLEIYNKLYSIYSHLKTSAYVS